MKRYGSIILILFLMFTVVYANEELNEKVQITKKEYLKLMIGEIELAAYYT